MMDMDVREERSTSKIAHATRQSVICAAILSLWMVLGMSVVIHLFLTRILDFPPSGSLTFLAICNAIIVGAIGIGTAQGLRRSRDSSPMSTSALRRMGLAFAFSGAALIFAVLALAREAFVVGIALALVALVASWRAAAILKEDP